MVKARRAASQPGEAGGAGALYLDSSAILRPVLEKGLSPALERKIRDAEILVTSRLSLVETARAFLRVRLRGEHPEAVVADAEREVGVLWRCCEIWELNREVCERAQIIAPSAIVRSLDALQLATFGIARREIAGLTFMTADERLRKAAEAV
jgi:predicted nucleic acid-binding protein